MNTGLILRNVGLILLLNAGFMGAAVAISVCSGFDTGFYPLLVSFLITALVGAFPLIFVPRGSSVSTKESYVTVVTAWVFSCLLGMLPYLIWGGEFSVVNAWFESTSGYTTTGATILGDVEALPRSLLFWRAATHWIGGVGVVLFAILILPSMGRMKSTLSSAEMSIMARDNFHYTTRKVLRIITTVYVGLTLAQMGALSLCGMGWFDALTTSFSTVATGGFSVRNDSIMYYQSMGIELVVAGFMLVSGLHMGLIYATLRGKRNHLFRSEVARFYVLSLVVCSLLVSWALWAGHYYADIWQALRYGFFQVVSYTTTTGFASTDNALWPPLAVVVMIYCMVQCAMAGSTTGGVKADRVLLAFKAIRARVLKMQHPSAVVRIKQNGVVQEDAAVNVAVLLIVIFMLATLVGTILLTAMNFDLLTAFTASVSCLSNVGPGFGRISGLESWGDFPAAAKGLMTGMMLFGRLEFFGFIHIFLLRSWK